MKLWLHKTQLFTVLITVFFISWSAAQDKELSVEEKIKVVEEEKIDSIQVNMRYKLCIDLIYDYPDIVITQIDKAIGTIDQSLPFPKFIRLKTHLLNLKGFAFKFLGKNYKSIEIFKKAAVIAKEQGFSGNLGEIYSNIAMVYAEQEQFDSTISYDLKALEVREKINSKKIGMSYNDLGIDYKTLNNYPKALEYYFKALDFKLKKGSDEGIGNTYFNIAQAYQFMSKLDSTIYYYNIALDHANESQDSFFIGQVLNGIGSSYAKQGKNKIAEEYLTKALSIIQNLTVNQNHGVIYIYQELAKVYLATNKIQAVEKLLLKTDNIISSNKLQVSNYMEANYRLWELYY